MLLEGSGEHVLRSPDNGGSDHGGNPVSRVQGWHRWGEASCSIWHMLVSWCGWSAIPSGFSPRPMPCDTDGPAGYLRGLPRRPGWVNGSEAVNCRRIIHHLPIDLHRPAQRLLYLCWDGQEEWAGRLPRLPGPADFQLGSQALIFFMQLVHLFT